MFYPYSISKYERVIPLTFKKNPKSVSTKKKNVSTSARTTKILFFHHTKPTRIILACAHPTSNLNIFFKKKKKKLSDNKYIEMCPLQISSERKSSNDDY